MNGLPTIDFERELNAEQLQAARAPDGPVLVIAAAGTGKTRTLTYRVAWLVHQGVDPRRILLLTFTNKAAQEMLDRAEKLVGAAVGGLWGGTFHHMANRMLRQHSYELGYRNDYTILDQDDSRSLVKKCVEALDLGGKEFPKPDVLLGVFGLASAREAPVADLAKDRFRDHDIEPEDIARVQRLYDERKRDLNAMDFDDLLVNGLRLFRERPAILEKYAERFLYVMVDEYQDTNAIQAGWVDCIASRHRNLLVVGDDFQSIYSWRGADFRNFLTFQKRYPDARIFKLETNYRSVPEILAVANASIAGNPEQFQKTLHATRDRHQKPVVARMQNGDEQALFLIDRIRHLRREGYKLRDICVLYRGHFHAMELQLLLAREHIPYVITSGVRFFEQAHIKDVCSFLRLVANPGDALAFARLLQLLPKLGDKTVSKLWNSLRGRFQPLEKNDRLRLEGQLPKAALAGWRKINGAFAAYADEGLEAHPGVAIEKFVRAFYDDYAITTFENYDRRMEDVKELGNFTGRFATTREFLNEVALLTNADAETDDPHAAPADAIRLSTIHQAKGLEWPVVFVLWLADGMFPSGKALNDHEGEAEERRLFYVATTRAKDELYLCVPAIRRTRDGGTQFFTPSRFVLEIPGNLLKEYMGYW